MILLIVDRARFQLTSPYRPTFSAKSCVLVRVWQRPSNPSVTPEQKRRKTGQREREHH